MGQNNATMAENFKEVRRPMIFELVFCGSCYLEAFNNNNEYAKIEKINMVKRRAKPIDFNEILEAQKNKK